MFINTSSVTPQRHFLLSFTATTASFQLLVPEGSRTHDKKAADISDTTDTYECTLCNYVATSFVWHYKLAEFLCGKGQRHSHAKLKHARGKYRKNKQI
jgi:hypothetical protein